MVTALPVRAKPDPSPKRVEGAKANDDAIAQAGASPPALST